MSNLSHVPGLQQSGAPGPSQSAPTYDELRLLWRARGGSFHGPIVETGTMPETTLLPLLRELTTKTAELEALRAELEACRVIVEAARNLCAVKGRHHTEIAMKRLMEAIKGGEPK